MPPPPPSSRPPPSGGDRYRQGGESNNNRASKRARHAGKEVRTSSVDVVDFAVARARELGALREAVRQQRGVRRVYQSLSWHARRRTMSHSARRMPLRLRAQHLQELGEQEQQQTKKKKKNRKKGEDVDDEEEEKKKNREYGGPRGFRRLRKFRGKARFVNALRRLRLSREQCMETHVWHAKRFSMQTIEGVRVAKRCNDRGSRSMLRAMDRKAVAVDMSFLKMLSVKACSKESLSKFLRDVSLSDDARRLTEWRALSGQRLVRDVVVGRKIREGEESGEWRPGGPVDVLRKVDGTEAWLWIRPECYEDVRGCLKDRSGRQEDADAVVVEQVKTAPGRVCVMGVKADDAVRKTVRGGLEEEPPWDDEGGARRAAADVVVGGRFVGGEEDGKGKGRGEGMKEELWEEEMRERMMMGREEMKEVPVIGMQCGSRDGMYGWDMIIPKGWVMKVWKHLLHTLRGRACSVDEVRDMQVRRQGVGVFPEDFVDCRGAWERVMREHTSVLETEMKKPLGKRSNVVVTKPFWETLDQVCRDQGDKLDEGLTQMTTPARKRARIMPTNIQTSPHWTVLRGVLEKRRRLGCLAGGGVGQGTRQGTRQEATSSDNNNNTMVMVTLTVMGKGVPRIHDVVVPHDRRVIIGAVVAGGFGMRHGVAVGRAILSVDGLTLDNNNNRPASRSKPPQGRPQPNKRLTEVPVRFASRVDAAGRSQQQIVWRDALARVILS